MIKITNDIFIKNAKSIHGDRYDYRNINYINNLTKVEIICKNHGPFLQTPRDHINKCGCDECGVLSHKNKMCCKNWLSDFVKIHGDRYDYSKVNYVKSTSKVEIICKEHGLFLQRPSDHKRGYGCDKCAISYRSEMRMDSNFLDSFIKTHGDKYDYSLVVYKNIRTKVLIICKEHGIFSQTPTSHKSGRGCPKCKLSRGESKIMDILIKKSIKFYPQYLFDGCKSKQKLPFDFFLPDKNICIEYDGVQHFEPIEYFGGVERFNSQKIKDEIKNKYCEENRIKMIRISYSDYDRIEDIVSSL